MLHCRNVFSHRPKIGPHHKGTLYIDLVGSVYVLYHHLKIEDLDNVM
jgi:hypothetical protein